VVRLERWPIAGSFAISRGAKTEAVTVVAEVSQGGHTGRGECVAYPRYGETPEATLAVGVDGPRGIWCHSCAVNTQLRSRP
jgi:L-alanine-DL-glutamate epimerase-like enolase superfamily enzyme